MGESSELSQRMQNYENFVQIQSDAAIRKIAGMYAYDYNESKDPVPYGPMTGRSLKSWRRN